MYVFQAPLKRPLYRLTRFLQIAAFRDISIDKNNAPKLQVFDIVLGSLYMAAVAVELLGLLGAILV